MLRLPSLGEIDRGLSSKVYLCAAACDMRKGFDTLAAMVREFFGQDPLSGHWFLFVGRGRDRLKILYWDTDGFVLWYKRLEDGTFKLPRVEPGVVGVELKASELAMLLDGIDLKSVKRSRRMTLGVKKHNFLEHSCFSEKLSGLFVYRGIVTTDGPNIPDVSTLPTDVATCHALIQQLLEQLNHSSRKLTQMEHQLQQLLQKMYGRSSEKIDPKQMALFSELLKQIEAQNPPAGESPVVEAAVLSASRNGHGRKRPASDLPRERVIHDLPEEEKACPCCGTMRTLIGQESSEQLDYVPAQVKVIEHVRLKYCCKECEKNAVQTGPQIVTAEKPLSPIEKGLAAPGLLAHVIISKYADSLPLHRLENIFERHGIDIARSTMCDWMRQAAEALTPLHNLMIQEVLASAVIHTDDTPVDVQDKTLGKTREGRFWVYIGDAAHPQIVFDFTPNRSRDGPMRFLQDWGKHEPHCVGAVQDRFLQADAFGGYDGLYKGQAGGLVTEVACWAHARRYFHDARKSDHRNSAQALAYIKLLYDVERDARDLTSHERATLRQERSALILADFRQWLTKLQATGGGSILPKSPMGEAITYAFNQWAALCVYLLHGELNIDNNASENALRRIAIGRKNWLFAGSDNGGRTAATLFSLIATCQRHQAEPFAYLRDVLTRIAAHPHHRLAELLPHNWKPKI